MNELDKIQEIVDELKMRPEYRQYVSQRKLHLLDSKWQVFDDMLEIGVLK